MQKQWLGIGVAILSLGIMACGSRRDSMVTIKGSDTMVILGQRWAESFMESHPGTVIQVTGGGSGTGIAALINGTTDLCQSSRPMKDDEKQQLQAKYGSGGTEITVARDGLTIYVHESSPIEVLSLAQIKSVYTGETTNWKAIGGPDRPITVYGRENSSGTYEYFKDHVLGGADFAAAVQTLPGTAAVVNAVAKDPNGIGYGGAAYAKGVREVAVRTDETAPAVLPKAEFVRNGSYPISRALYFYTRRPPEGGLREFVDYVLSDSGQAVVTEVGYFPIR